MRAGGYTEIGTGSRAAVSVSSNIAEGAERGSARDFVRFLHISKGSLAELRTQLLIASRVGVLSEAQSNSLSAKCRRISGMLQALIKHQNSKAYDETPEYKLPPDLTPNT